ncbi:centrosomal protein of 78 kDa isoform X1 [Tachysurus ichikawai]
MAGTSMPQPTRQITNSLQKASSLQSSTSSSAASAVSKNSRNLQSPQDVIPTPAPHHFSLSPSPLDHPDALHLQQRVSPNQSNSNRESGSDKPGSRRHSKSSSSASSVHLSVHSKLSYSYRVDVSEGTLSPALSSRSSSMSRFGSERISERHSEGQRSAVWLAGL